MAIELGRVQKTGLVYSGRVVARILQHLFSEREAFPTAPAR